MTLSSYELNATYQKTQLQYEAKITPTTQEISQKKDKEDDFEKIGDSIAPIVYTDESSLSDPQKFQKMLMEKILGSFDNGKEEQSLFPNDYMNMNKESYEKDNPYAQSINSLPQGLLYSSSSEYYEKTTIDFSAQATIKTPSGEYNIEINFSYTKEFYERNETQISLANENFKNPFEIKLDKDNEELKGLKSLHFIIDVYKEQKDEDKNDIFEQLRELLAQRRETLLEMFKKDDENKEIQKLDNFQIWQETSNNEMSLVAVQKDGIGVFLANSSSESSFLNLNVNSNGYSLEAAYSKSETSYTQVTSEVKE